MTSHGHSGPPAGATRSPDPHEGFPVGCLVTDPDRVVREANAYLGGLLGRADGALVGSTLEDLLSGGSVAMLESYIVPLLARDGCIEEILLKMLDAEGRVVPVLANARRVEGTGDTRWAIFPAVGHDRLYQELVSARRSLEERAAELAERAATDPLTGLSTRAELEREAARMLARAERAAQPASLLLVDIDGFKAVNDGFGHATGDELLQAMGPLLRGAVRGADVVARHGGDEFALMLDNAGAADARAAAARVNAAARGLDVTGARITVSIGAATAAGRRCPGFAELYGRADAALYEAKRQGRDRAVIEAAR